VGREREKGEGIKGISWNKINERKKLLIAVGGKLNEKNSAILLEIVSNICLIIEID
jgi:hypothetical protein